jgi:hypothetical protein
MKKALLPLIAVVCVCAALSQQPPAAVSPSNRGGGAGGASGGRGPGRVQPDPVDFNDHPGWQQLFDGTTLTGWDGNSDVWKVVDGVIAGEFNTPAGTRNGQTFLIWKGGEVADYELKLEIKMEGITADSGIQYRAYLLAPGQGRGAAAAPAPAGPLTSQSVQWNLGGYQFDFNYPGNYDGHEAEAGPGARGIIAYRGQVVRAEEGKRPRLVGTLGTMESLGGCYRHNDWNQVHLIARGNTFTHLINGHVMSIFIDEDPTKFKPKGLIGLQCAGSGTVQISFRNIWLRRM